MRINRAAFHGRAFARGYRASRASYGRAMLGGLHGNCRGEGRLKAESARPRAFGGPGPSGTGLTGSDLPERRLGNSRLADYPTTNQLAHLG